MRRVAEAVVSAMTGRMGFAIVAALASSSTVDEAEAAEAAEAAEEGVMTIVTTTAEMTAGMMIDAHHTTIVVGTDTMIETVTTAETVTRIVMTTADMMTVVGTVINLFFFPSPHLFSLTIRKRNGKEHKPK